MNRQCLLWRLLFSVCVATVFTANTLRVNDLPHRAYAPSDAVPIATQPIYFTTRVSVATGGAQADVGTLCEPALSADGRFIAFDSTSSDLVPGDTNGTHDVFVRDRATGRTERVSITTDGSQGTLPAWSSAISADGRNVAFQAALELVTDTGIHHVYVRDRQTGKTTLVSAASDGTPGDAQSGDPAVSASGRWIAFSSMATNLVEGDTNSASDVFVHDRQSGITRRVSVASGGTQGNSMSFEPSISADARFVAFTSFATNLVGDDTNFTSDVFIHDIMMGDTSRVSAQLEGIYSNGEPDVSSNGRWVVFTRHYYGPGPNITEETIHVYVVDRSTNTETRVSVNSDGKMGNYPSYTPAISDDGRYIAFNSAATNLVPNDLNNEYDIFIHDLQTGETQLASVSSTGEQGWGYTTYVGISGDGRVIGFSSMASNLVPDDTNDGGDVFVRYAPLDATRLYFPVVHILTWP